ncbi:MAG: DMT family protein [Commensalibacter sp.]|nr:DMT family protein [Commensalibacter sp.]
MPVWLITALMLICSNIFMTFAWYGHLRSLENKPWFIAAIISWAIAFGEYMIQVPANRIGFTKLSLGELKIMQEAITLMVFVPFSIFFMHQPMKLDYLWACLCVLGAVFFIFRNA